MPHTITEATCQQMGRIAQSRMLISKYVNGNCSDLTLVECQAVLLCLLSDVTGIPLKDEAKEAELLSEIKDG